MAVQLILYPQVYDGYYSWQAFTSNSTSTGANPSNNTNTPILTPVLTPQILGNANFGGSIFGGPTNIGVSTSSSFANNSIALRQAPAPVGRWRLSYTDNLASNKPFVEAGKLNLTTATTQSNSFAYTTVTGLQAGNQYRVLVVIDKGPIGKLKLGNTGEGSWRQQTDTNGLTQLRQLGGDNGAESNGTSWVDARTGMTIGNPLRTAINTPTRFYINFTARGPVEVLQLNLLATSATQTPLVISNTSLVTSPTSPGPLTVGPSINAGGNNTNTTNNQTVQTAAPSLQTFLDDGQVILDLYKDESIPLNLSVDDFTKVDEKIASYSKSFMIPATKHNNKIFSFYYDVSRSQNADVFMFNPFAKTKAIIKDDTVLVFEGWMKLINVQTKNGQVSYNINLYSEPTTFCDYLKGNALSNLDFDELGHDYSKDTVPDSWDPTIGLPLTTPLLTTSSAYDPALGVNNTNALKYPFINWSGQFELTDPNTIFTGMPENTFRPVMQCKYLLDRMFEATPFTYDSTFLNGHIFKKAYMDYNYSGDAAMLAATYTQIDEQDFAASSSGSWENIIMPITSVEVPVGTAYSSYDNQTGVFTMQNDGELMTVGQPRFYRDFFNGVGEYRAKVDKTANGGGITFPNSGNIHFNTYTWGGPTDCAALDGTNAPIVNAGDAQCGAGRCGSLWLIFNLQAGDTLTFQFRRASGGGSIWQSTNEQVSTWNQEFLKDSYNNKERNSVMYIITGGISTMSFLQQGIRAQLMQYDFWKGIKQMFNLVTVPDKTNPNNLIIEPYNDLFLNNSDTKLIDWTEKVDASNIKISPLNKLPKVTEFTYIEDAPDYRVKQYKNALGGYLYGTKSYEAGDMFFSLLTGTKKITAKPFAPTMYAPLTMLFPDFICSHIYKANEDGTDFQPFANKPRILFDEGVKNMPLANGNPVAFRVAWLFGFGATNYTTYGSMSHLSLSNPTSPSTMDLNFGECPLVTPIGGSPVNNLFNTYWLPYYQALYNPDCRSVKLKLKLTPKDLNEFNFYDKIQIKNQIFRVNKIQYNSGVLATVELILIP
tara:strand:- start:343 stop:3486 length:3144 start_codon:yes stop_codon:yes gene_type:complete